MPKKKINWRKKIIWWWKFDEYIKAKPKRFYLALMMMGAMFGCLLSIFVPNTVKIMIEGVQKTEHTTVWSLIIHNYSIFIVMTIFSFVSLALLSFNYFTLGVVLGSVITTASAVDPMLAIIGLTPHGIPELLSFFFLPYVAINFKKNWKRSIVFWLILLGVLAFAGFVEFYLTYPLLKWYVTNFIVVRK